MYLGPGKSSCFYYANIDAICQLQLVEVKALPESCTSFVANGLAVNTKFNVYTPLFEGYNYGKLYLELNENEKSFLKK